MRRYSCPLSLGTCGSSHSITPCSQVGGAACMCTNPRTELLSVMRLYKGMLLSHRKDTGSGLEDSKGLQGRSWELQAMCPWSCPPAMSTPGRSAETEVRQGAPTLGEGAGVVAHRYDISFWGGDKCSGSRLLMAAQH